MQILQEIDFNIFCVPLFVHRCLWKYIAVALTGDIVIPVARMREPRIFMYSVPQVAAREVMHLEQTEIPSP